MLSVYKVDVLFDIILYIRLRHILLFPDFNNDTIMSKLKIKIMHLVFIFTIINVCAYIVYL